MEARTRRLVSLPLEPAQEQEILRRLDAAGVAHKETRSLSRFFGSNAIWVPEADYLRAKEIMDRQAAEYAGAAREQWQAEWQREHGGSYARWLLHRMRRATMDDVLRVLLLAALVGLMLLYPIAFMR
jgi:hypothetical protein